MAAPTVREIFNSDTGFEDTLDGGLFKTRKFLVNTGDELAARVAAGVPRRGDKYSTAQPGLIATRIRGFRRGGVDDANGVGAVTEVVVQYGEIGSQWGGTVKEVQPAGVQHTVLGGGNEQIEIGASVNDAGEMQTGEHFNNGRPAQKWIGREIAEVYDFRPLSYQVPYPTLRSYKSDKPTNLDSIVLPPPLGLTQGIPLPAKTALYFDYRVEARPDAILIVHELHINDNGFNHIWAIPDNTYRIVAFGNKQIYRAAAFGGLW